MKKIKIGLSIICVMFCMLITFPSKAANIGLTTSNIWNDGAVLKWEAVNKCQTWNYDTRLPQNWGWAYNIERATSQKGSYKYIGRSNETNFTDNDINLVPGKTYYYRIAYMVNNTVNYSTVLGVRLRSVFIPPLSVHTVKNNSVIIKWDEVENCRSWNYDTQLPNGYYHYYLERATSQNGKYKYIGKTNYLNYADNDSTLVPGKTYYYRIKCMVNSTVFTSQPVAAKLKNFSVSKPKITSKKKNKVTIKWKHVTNATGWNHDTKLPGGYYKYYILRSTHPNKKFKVIGYTNDNRYTDNNNYKNFQKKKKYYYKVKAMVNHTIKTSKAITVKPRK